MTICITGMHRSGTSMVARMLNLCGLYLGHEEQLMPPDEGNPTGYWQNQAMDQLTEDIMGHFAGEWDFLLPSMPQGWEMQNDMESYRKRAQQLIQALGLQEPWGWKDPRCSVILPFWKSILSNLKIVVCLRNPVATARSLARHVGSTDAFSYNLWLQYYRRILNDTGPCERLITHYDTYFLYPDRELQRLLDWLGWSISGEQLKAAIETVSDSQRRYHPTETELHEAKVPLEVAEAYTTLCAEGGEVLKKMIDDGSVPLFRMDKTIGGRLPDTDTSSPESKKAAAAEFDRAHELITQNDYAGAVEAMQTAVSLNPFHAQAQNDLGVLLSARGDKEQASIHLGFARQLDPDNSDTAKNLAEVYLDLGRTEDALQIFLGIVDRHPQDIEALYHLGTACASMGHEKQARELYSRILEMEINHAGAKAGLAMVEKESSLND